jgi:hypothetical protein
MISEKMSTIDILFTEALMMVSERLKKGGVSSHICIHMTSTIDGTNKLACLLNLFVGNRKGIS